MHVAVLDRVCVSHTRGLKLQHTYVAVQHMYVAVLDRVCVLCMLQF